MGVTCFVLGTITGVLVGVVSTLVFIIGFADERRFT